MDGGLDELRKRRRDRRHPGVDHLVKPLRSTGTVRVLSELNGGFLGRSVCPKEAGEWGNSATTERTET